MKYRWKKHGEEDWDIAHTLYLILDDAKYGFAEINWYPDIEKWELFVSGFVSDDVLEIEREYELLSDAKRAAHTYMTVWWVTGAMQRMNDDEKRQWRGVGAI